jgi:uncharacterized protein (DUF427 family)
MPSDPLPAFDPERFRREGRAIVDWIADYWHAVADKPVQSPVEPGWVGSQLPAVPPEQPEQLDAVLADLDRVIVPGLTHWQHPGFFAYFPASALKKEHFKPSDTHTVCGWKGTASYYDVVVGASVNKDAAWYYPQTKDAAKHVEGRVAFWKGVVVR